MNSEEVDSVFGATVEFCKKLSFPSFSLCNRKLKSIKPRRNGSPRRFFEVCGLPVSLPERQRTHSEGQRRFDQSKKVFHIIPEMLGIGHRA